MDLVTQQRVLYLQMSVEAGPASMDPLSWSKCAFLLTLKMPGSYSPLIVPGKLEKNLEFSRSKTVEPGSNRYKRRPDPPQFWHVSIAYVTMKKRACP